MRRSVARSASYEDTDKDDFPTPPWVTRAFFKYVAPELMRNHGGWKIYDPACGRGHMLTACRSIKFRADRLYGSDILTRWSKQTGKRPYWVVGQFDYLNCTIRPGAYDLIITNPPYKLANAFVERMLKQARVGVALLARTNWVEGGREHKGSRWARILRGSPPTRIAVISGRMPAAHGKIVQHRPVFVSHSWFYWDKREPSKHTEFRWIPPEAQRLLERPEDYR